MRTFSLSYDLSGTKTVTIAAAEMKFPFSRKTRRKRSGYMHTASASGASGDTISLTIIFIFIFFVSRFFFFFFFLNFCSICLLVSRTSLSISAKKNKIKNQKKWNNSIFWHPIQAFIPFIESKNWTKKKIQFSLIAQMMEIWNKPPPLPLLALISGHWATAPKRIEKWQNCV